MKGYNVLYVAWNLTLFPLRGSIRPQDSSVSGISTVVYCLKDFSALALLFDCVKGLVSSGTRRMARCT